MTNNSHLCSNLTASYKYCCYGMHCPSCAVRLYLHVLDRAFLVHSSLQMNCITHAYDVTVGAFSKPGRYTTKVTRPTFGYYLPRYDDYHCPYPHTPHPISSTLLDPVFDNWVFFQLVVAICLAFKNELMERFRLDPRLGCVSTWFWVSGSTAQNGEFKSSFHSSVSRLFNVECWPRNSILSLDAFRYVRSFLNAYVAT